MGSESVCGHIVCFFPRHLSLLVYAVLLFVMFLWCFFFFPFSSFSLLFFVCVGWGIGKKKRQVLFFFFFFMFAFFPPFLVHFFIFFALISFRMRVFFSRFDMARFYGPERAGCKDGRTGRRDTGMLRSR